MQEAINIHETAGLAGQGTALRPFPEVLKEVQEYVSRNFSSVLQEDPDGNR